MHGTENVSEWVLRWSHLVAPRSTLLDVASGAGRHSLHFLKRNCRVAAVDIAQSALDLIAHQLTPDEKKRCELICADIENHAWPLVGRRFDAVVVTHYLWRPLLPMITQSLSEGGVLIYETFCSGHETVGKPSRPDFLLKPGELLQVCSEAGLRVIAFEDGFLNSPERFMQRVVAVREKTSSNLPARHALQA